ncbi:hypothetical protein HHK36_029448 [Tetracentron sinense]|uniref:RING-type E3 ubiquitin transferase n=1 Tax=Tetracentron sinense TaxID=13715 RepID=A0A834Y9M0_TETSI|nr:hypothetical protein HHK36_029448 [Tetracentron sinense]
MDVAEIEESLFADSDAKLHGGMCSVLSAIVCKVLKVFPDLEAARPRSKSGLQALCSLHVALEKAKNLLQHCSDCSKLYLAITGESILLKYEKARCSLLDSLRRVEDIVPQSIGCQISDIVSELEGTMFSLDPLEKQVGDKMIALLQQERKCNSNSIDNKELESFHQAASILGITSSRTALTERRALKKLIERAHIEEDKRKESILAYLLHLMRKYSKLFRGELSDDNDSQGSGPCSPTVQGSLEDGVASGGNFHAFKRELSKLNTLNFMPQSRRLEQMPLAPEEFRCPISLQLMYDPVIISSGQTYERICIEKWFSDGHSTCPKTQQQLMHLYLTPNYCVKGIIASWCEQNGFPIPNGPPESLDLNHRRLALCECESTNSRSMERINSCDLKGVNVVPLEDSGIPMEFKGNKSENVSSQEDGYEMDMVKRYESLLAILYEGEDTRRRCKVVEQIRLLLKDDEEARIFMGANGFVDALVQFVGSAVHEGNEEAQEIGAMALFNLAVNNDRNKKMMLSAGVIPLVDEMILKSNSYVSATALYLNLSYLNEAKPIIGLSQAVPFLVRLLQAETERPCKLDALRALYNLSTHSSNIPRLISADVIEGIQSLLTGSTDHTWAENSIAVFINLASSKSGKEKIISAPGLISGLAAILDTDELYEQEQAVSCLLILCNGNEKCCEMVLQEGVIPALVSISVNGTTRGKEKAQKLLMLFREQRQRDPSPVQRQTASSSRALPVPESKPQCKSTSRKMGRAWTSIWKSKNFSVYQC